MINKLFMFWCCTHGYCVDDPRAAEEYGMWNAEIDAYNEYDCDEYGNLVRYTGQALLWDRLHWVEIEMSAADAEAEAEAEAEGMVR